ncbi:MAG: AsmA family protein [Desulfobacteraceae bacterium]
MSFPSIQPKGGKMKKWLLIGFVVIVLVIAGVVVFGLSKIGPIIQSAVNTYGPGITKTDVSLGDVDISIFSAQAKLKDFYLGNPKGFQSPEAMKVGSILVDVDEKSLTKDTIVIDRIEVLQPQITYERNERTDNFQAILNNVTKGARKSKPTSGKTQSEQSAGGKKIIIRDFQLNGGQVNLAASLLGQNKSVDTQLPDIHLTDIGKNKGGVKPEEAFRIIFAELSKHINSPDVMKVFSEQLKGLNLDPKILEGTSPEEIKSVGNKLKNLLGK